MIDALIDRVDAFCARWRVSLAVASGLWFALTCAAYANFIDLPAIVIIGGLPGVILAGLWNAIWWGLLYPRAERRRAARTNARGKVHG